MGSPKEKPGADLKTALETFAGHPIDASTQQIEQQIRKLVLPFSTYSFTPQAGGDPGENVGQVVSRSIVVFVPPSCASSELLDVSGIAVTSDTGSTTVLVKSFLCPTENSRFYSEPVNVVATPASSTPVFLTVTHTLVVTPPNTSPTDVQINIFAWDATGAPAPGVPVNWRCRVPASIILL